MLFWGTRLLTVLPHCSRGWGFRWPIHYYRMEQIWCHLEMQTQFWDEGENNRHDSLFGQCAALRNRAMWKCTKDTAFHCVTWREHAAVTSKRIISLIHILFNYHPEKGLHYTQFDDEILQYHTKMESAFPFYLSIYLSIYLSFLRSTCWNCATRKSKSLSNLSPLVNRGCGWVRPLKRVPV